MKIQTPDEFIQEYERATNSHDLEATLAMIGDGAIYLFSDGSVHAGKHAIEQVLRHNFDIIQDETYSVSHLTWLARSSEVAACVYDFSWSGTVQGKPASGFGRGTSVLVQSSDGWRVIHEHLSKGRFAG